MFGKTPEEYYMEGSIQLRLEYVLRTMQQGIAEAEAWADLRLEHQPLDCETERVVAQLARRALAALDAGDMLEVLRCNALIRESLDAGISERKGGGKTPP